MAVETPALEVEQALARAAAVASPYAATAPDVRARALVAAAEALEIESPRLVAIAQRETGLTEPRLNGELHRTAVQLRLFADTVAQGAYLDVRIDPADPDFAIGPRPDLRRTQAPIGPVLNFAASNFPFAFSVAGGDSAAVLAAGCPLVVKANPGHPELSNVTADVIAAAMTSVGIPDGVLQLIHGQDNGVAALKDPRIMAGSFTGSIHAGRLLAGIAANRPAPIPFFAEMGSVNPVFATADALAEYRETLATDYVASVSGSAGQLCTKPGFLFLPEGHDVETTVATTAADVEAHRLLTPRLARNYGERRQAILGTPGVRAIAEGSLRFDEAGHGWATPTIVAVSLGDFRANHHTLIDEAFGPLSIMVEVPPSEMERPELPSEFFAGNLTATVHMSSNESSGNTENRQYLSALITQLTSQVGRVLFGGWPTGVAVTPAMHHGGPWPAATIDSTSVGTAAIRRFIRPVCYQNAPQAFLPEALMDSNPRNIPRAYAPAGESTSWGERPSTGK